MNLRAQEKKDTVVKMSTIIGSKIGGGFYQNSEVTTIPDYGYVVDEFNRITGNPFKIPQDKLS